MTLTLPAAIIGGVFGFALWAFVIMILTMIAFIASPEGSDGGGGTLHPSTPGWIISYGAVSALVFHIIWG